ncbi:methylated-DNA--[protein]-cysteine S-methyltransferase [Halodesulfovibrio marinisediminis]|uniref:Methylated-DNA--protein-cysteine methyltransferase n=1 Tax=Halodesulfovibrio marinisediminis DSM 17456 TaxID=1121457 RepID=A0A1N6FZI5_9BACT|nr:MGMT family protein [Halodesulfovibrio marinisediminis]SIO00610.1 methylated-DNA-[protein]-cysteine S-methyltransferase [Halodesulfovibrio marinisediminis DSM 17456]
MYLPEIEQIVGNKLRLILNWQDDTLTEISLQWADGESATEELSDMGKQLQDCLLRYEAGEPVQWPDIYFALEKMTPFGQKVLTALMQVPYGKTVTYGELAALAGSPNAARGVGQVMARNRWPLIIPCHRVVSASGLGGFSAQGLDMKRYLLDIEGVLHLGKSKRN